MGYNGYAAYMSVRVLNEYYRFPEDVTVVYHSIMTT